MNAVSRTRWQEAIDQSREEWDTLAWQQMSSTQYRQGWARHLRELGLSLEAFAGQTVLDIGCGPTGAIYFVEAAHRVGLDPLADQYEQWNGHHGAPVELVTGEAEAIPFPDASFGAVLCINCLDHTRDPAAGIREIARVLKPSGMLVLHMDLDSPLRKLHKRLRKHAGILHPHSITRRWLLDQLAPSFVVEGEHRDPEVFRATRSQMRYEAFWDGLLYRLTRGSDTWINHVWIRARRRPDDMSHH